MKYESKGFLKFSEEDIYSEGCIPETSTSCMVDVEFTANKASELVDKMKEYLDVDDDCVLLDSCEEAGRVDFQVMENEQGYKASKSDISIWKTGKIRLWAVTYSAMVEKVHREAVSLI